MTANEKKAESMTESEKKADNMTASNMTSSEEKAINMNTNNANNTTTTENTTAKEASMNETTAKKTATNEANDYRYVVYRVKQAQSPQIVDRFNGDDATKAIAAADSIAKPDQTAYVFDTTLGLRGHSPALIYVAGFGWKLITEQDLTRKVTTSAGSYIDWMGREVKGCMVGNLYKSWGQKDALEVDFLHLGDRSLEEVDFSKPERINEDVIEAAIERLCVKYGALPTKPLENENPGAVYEFDALADAYRHMCLEIMSALPKEKFGMIETIENPALRFAKDVKAGRYDSLTNAQYNDLYDRISRISALWNDAPSIKLGLLAWKALAAKACGVDVAAYIAGVYDQRELSEVASLFFSPRVA